MQGRSFWRPRVMKHLCKDGVVEYAIHEVFFEDYGERVSGYSKDALSPRAKSVIGLQRILIQLIDEQDRGVICGDLSHTYHNEDIQLWLLHMEDFILEFEDAE